MVGEIQNTNWPLPKFYFSVDISDVANDLAFQEVSGLDASSEVIEYRAGNSPIFSKVKMPGMVENGNVTLKKGIFNSSNSFWDWYNQIKMNTMTRHTITIKLLDQEGSPTMVWRLKNAWPAKISAADLRAEGNEVAIESIELVHEGITVENG
jgi:phage tail-like protein